MTAGGITRLLSQKHSDDVFVPECKIGRTGPGCSRLDAWAMRKSWAKPCVIGYEIKVSRSDFLGDYKWNKYLKFCNELYFVSPYKMIDPSELSNGVGLIWVSKTGNRLFTKRKAEFRNVSIPESIFRYILMARVKVLSGCHDSSKPDAEFWNRWLDDNKKTKIAGRRLGARIGEKIESAYKLANRENERLRRENESLQDVRDFLIRNGISLRYDVSERIQEKMNGIDANLIFDLERIKARLGDAINRLKKPG